MHIRPITILVADDNQDFLDNVSEILSDEGYEVLKARDGEEAIQIARSSSVDLVILDLKMPRKTGIEAYLEIQPTHPRSKAILMTAYPSESTLAQAHQNVEVIKKPFKLEDLLNLVEVVQTQVMLHEPMQTDPLSNAFLQMPGIDQEWSYHTQPLPKEFNLARIMIIDDHQEYAENIAEIVAEQGWQCEIASSGMEAKRKISKAFYAAVLIDLVLPDIQGLSLLEYIHSHSPDSFCLILTGTATLSTAISALNQGAQAYITKDAPLEEVVAYLKKAWEKLQQTLEKRHLQQELIASERKFRATFDSAPIAIGAFDRQGKVLLWNPTSEHMFGYLSKDICGKSIFDTIIRSEDRERFEEILEHVFWGKSFLNLEWVYYNQNRDLVEALICVIPIRDASDEVSFAIATALDLTELKVLQKKIIDNESLARIGMMATTLAHEIKNPLAGIQGAIQLLQKRVSLPPMYQNILVEVLGKINQLSTIIGDLLSYARPVLIRKQKIHIAALVNQIFATQCEDPLFHSITFHIEYEDPNAVCYLDPIQIQQALTNLLMNAAQAISGKGEIWIKSRIEKGFLIFTVEDSGPGIAKDHMNQLFIPFFTTKHHGTGLGLAITRKIILAHHGEIIAKNRPEGGGLFEFTLPCI